MRIGMMIGGGAGESPHTDELIRLAQRIEAAGLHSAWLTQFSSHGTIGLLELTVWSYRSFRCDLSENRISI